MIKASLWDNEQLLADPELFERYREIAFNAGRLDASMVLDAGDNLRIARPELARIRPA